MELKASSSRLPHPSRDRSQLEGRFEIPPMAEVEKKLGSSANGLTQAEAQKRLTHYGPNEIAEKKTNELLKFLGYFWGPIPWMIEAAVVLSAVARHWPDFAIILLLLVANARVGFWEEPGRKCHRRAQGHAGVLGTQALATPIAVYGLLMTPLGWGWALFVWGYALAWFLVNDRVKLLAYRILDPAKTSTLSDLTPAALSASVV